jgi:hypothetical protein
MEKKEERLLNVTDRPPLALRLDLQDSCTCIPRGEHTSLFVFRTQNVHGLANQWSESSFAKMRA